MQSPNAGRPSGHEHKHDEDGHGDDDHPAHETGGDHAGHAHAHAPTDFGFAFAVGTALNLGIVVLEVVFGLLSNSMALLADAGHNLSDVFGLLMAWGASHLVKRRPTDRFTYGLGMSSILAALGNAIFLLVASGAIAWEAVQRFSQPEDVASKTVMIVAAIGIAVNAFTAWLFVSGREDDINIRGAFLHLAGDAAISLGVVLSGLLMLVTGWSWVDPVVSLVIVVLIVWGTWGLLRESAGMALHAVPPGIDPRAVRTALESLPGVEAVHDLHIWPLSTTSTALTCHLVMPDGAPGDAFIAGIAEVMRTRFKIGHVTIQIERQAGQCALEAEGVV